MSTFFKTNTFNIMKKLSVFFKNKYLLILAVFAIWMIFIDQDNLYRQYELTQEQQKAEEENEFLSTGFKNDSIMNYQLENDPKAMEKYARENYLMKKDDETLIRVVDQEEEK